MPADGVLLPDEEGLGLRGVSKAAMWPPFPHPLPQYQGVPLGRSSCVALYEEGSFIMQSMQKITTRQLVLMALLVAMAVVLSRFLSISTQSMKIGFSFVPIVLLGMLYGPIWAGVCAAMADFIGAILFPVGAYFPGFTLTAALTGVVYGLFLYKQPKPLRVVAAVGLVEFGLNLILNTWWIHLLYGTNYLALLPTRALKNVVMFPIQIVIILLIIPRLAAFKKKA